MVSSVKYFAVTLNLPNIERDDDIAYLTGKAAIRID